MEKRTPEQIEAYISGFREAIDCLTASDHAKKVARKQLEALEKLVKEGTLWANTPKK